MSKVSSRLRYEVLKRDSHTCQYCGATAPEAVLQIDHIVPVSLGGDNTAANLLTACVACNAGKASTGPTESAVAAPSMDAKRWVQAIEEAATQRRRYRASAQEARGVFLSYWPWSYPPDDWQTSVDRFIRLGLAPEDIQHFLLKAVERCEGMFEYTWRYFCKVCWSEVKTLQKMAVESLASEPEPAPAPDDDLGAMLEEAWQQGLEDRRAAEAAAAWNIELGPCIECDDRTEVPVRPRDGMCDQCRRLHYEGTA